MDRARRSRAACTRTRRVSDTNPVGSAPEVRYRPRCSTASGACPDIARDGLVASNVLCPPSFAPILAHRGIPGPGSRRCSNTLRPKLCPARRAAMVETLRFQEGRNLPCQAYDSYSTPLSECCGLVSTIHSNLETGDYRVRQRGARAGGAGEAEAPGVSLHDHGGAFVAARHGGGRGGTASRGAG